ncbi:class I adenylate-forming enzyme family protein [Streptomyces sp. JB150]|uniref:class I adenylate-forming enzyme family protein n=1 Tax=Streptomyces sp. JB150 TaxID=2714844 RepID=UPI001F0D997E|nr:class I adenylate-forming enzyme family protein [Streptomyces sp. JB150]
MNTRSHATVLHELLDLPGAGADAPAVTCGEVTLTRAELVRAAHRCAAALRARGLRRGDRLVVTSDSGPVLVPLLFGASRLGVVFSVLHEQVRGDVLRHVLADCEPALAVAASPATRAAVREAGVAAVAPEDVDDLSRAAATDPATSADGDLPDTEPAAGHTSDTVLIAGDTSDSGLAAGATSDTDSAAGAASGTGPGDGPLPVDPVCLIYTSGTTAMPKAVVSTHQQMLFAVHAIAERLEYRADDVVYCPLPLSFDYGLYQVFLGALAGSHVWLGSATESGPALLANLVRSQATVLPAVPPVSAALVRLLRRRRDAARPPLRLLTNTGAALPADIPHALREELPGLSVRLMFGLTECKRLTISEPDEDAIRPGSCGRPLTGTEVFVVDEEGRRLPAGEVGEITVRGANVMAGYWRRPELTATRFPRRDGLFPELRTGDYGWTDEDGRLYFAGRRDDIYKQDGFRVSAIEVEAAARRLPDVDTAAVLPPDATRPEAVLVVTGTADPATVLPRLREHLEDYKVPRTCHAVDALPVNANGKTAKAVLAGRLAEAGRD